MYKISILPTIFLLGLFLGQSQEKAFPENRKQAVITVMKQYTAMGLPGLAVSTYTPDTGLWSHAEGYANLEDREPLVLSH